MKPRETRGHAPKPHPGPVGATYDCHNIWLADIDPGKVSASMMYATARFNAYVSWIGFQNAADMAEKRDETVRYIVDQYRPVLFEHSHAVYGVVGIGHDIARAFQRPYRRLNLKPVKTGFDFV